MQRSIKGIHAASKVFADYDPVFDGQREGPTVGSDELPEDNH